MARKPIHLSIPDLRTLRPRFAGFVPSSNHQALLAAELRDLIGRIRRPTAVPFYPMRRIEAFFGVSHPTVARAYAQLESEGLLTRVRGTHTLMEGSREQPRRSVRATVGVAICLPTFVIGSELRRFYVRLEEELRRRSFVVNFIFYRQQDEQAPGELAERFVLHQPDILLWMSPPARLTPALRRVADTGIRLVIVDAGKGPVPGSQYALDKDRALASAFRHWKGEGVTEVVTLQASGAQTNPEEIEIARKAVASCSGLKGRVLTLEDAAFPAFVARAARTRGLGVALSPHAWYESLSNQFPREMETLCRSCRVLLMQGPVHHDSLRRHAVRVDAILFPDAQMATRIARDIGDGTVRKTGCRVIFHSTYEAGLDLGLHSQEI